MKSAGGIALLLVLAVSIVGWAQCDCGVLEASTCYLAFKSNETIAFSLVAPVDYFMCQGTTVSPSIFGWRVEAADGTVVRLIVYPGEPRGRMTAMEWDLYDDAGYLVPAGNYQIIVMTTDSDVAYPVRVVEACHSCWGCFCGCYIPPTCCDSRCRIPYGELYLTLDVGETRPCSGLTINLSFTVECSSP